MAHHGPHVRLIHRFKHRDRAVALFLDDSPHGTHRLQPQHQRQLLEVPAFVFGMMRGGSKEDLLGTEAAYSAFAATAAKRGVLEHRGKRSAARGVRILVGGNVLALGAGLLDKLERVAYPSPVLLTGSLVMRDLHRHSRFRADPNRFADGVEELAGLVTHVARVKSAAAHHLASQFDDLLGTRVTPGLVDESG